MMTSWLTMRSVELFCVHMTTQFFRPLIGGSFDPRTDPLDTPTHVWYDWSFVICSDYTVLKSYKHRGQEWTSSYRRQRGVLWWWRRRRWLLDSTSVQQRTPPSVARQPRQLILLSWQRSRQVLHAVEQHIATFLNQILPSIIAWPTIVLLSPALCLECDNGS